MDPEQISLFQTQQNFVPPSFLDPYQIKQELAFLRTNKDLKESDNPVNFNDLTSFILSQENNFHSFLPILSHYLGYQNSCFRQEKLRRTWDKYYYSYPSEKFDYTKWNDILFKTTDKETEDTEKEEETNTGNEKLANTFFSEYNKQKTQEAVNYINQQMKKDEMYEELGGYAVAVTSKPTNNWMSYSSNSKLDGMALAGCKVSVYVENYYRYNSKGTDYYLYDTKIYVYQEVI